MDSKSVIDKPDTNKSDKSDKPEKKKHVLSKMPPTFLNKLENLMGGRTSSKKTEEPKKSKPKRKIKKFKFPKPCKQIPKTLSLTISEPPPIPPPLPNISNQKLESLELTDIPKQTSLINNQSDRNPVSRQSDPDFYRFATELIKEQNKYNIEILDRIMYITEKSKVKSEIKLEEVYNQYCNHIKKYEKRVYSVLGYIGGIITSFLIYKFL